MSPAKVIAFLLGLASLALLLLFGFVAFAGPIMVAPPPPLDKQSEGCLGLVLFASSLPLVAIPGIAGACLWFFVVRKQEAAANAEAVSGLDREASFQDRLDGLTPRLLAHGGDAAALAPEIPLWTRDLDGPRQNRLLRLLAACGGEGPGEIAPPLPAIAAAGTASPAWGTRALSFGLLGIAAFCTLWGAFVAFANLTSNLGEILDLPGGPKTAAYGSGSCFVIALAAFLGGLALHWLNRREARRHRWLTIAQQGARDVILERGRRRLAGLFQQDDGAATGRIGRAHFLSTLPELDGAGKGSLLAWLHAGGHLAGLALAGADLRGAELVGADLSAVALDGTDLSGAVLTGARLVEARLRGCRLRGADLRGANATGADLRGADLRQARMHRCDLRRADLRGANLEEANLWQALLPDPIAGSGGVPS